MLFSLQRLHFLKIGAACVALCLALLYLGGQEVSALVGFLLFGAIGGFLGIRLRQGNLPARCDLCGRRSVLGAEYGAGFSNARLVLSCPVCGRVVNSDQGAGKPTSDDQ